MAGKKSATAKIREQDYVALVPKMKANAMPHLPWPSGLSPSGLVPSACKHGLKALPPNHPPMARTPRIDPLTGGELPYIGKSWVRSRYMLTTMTCVMCAGQSRPSVTEYRT